MRLRCHKAVSREWQLMAERRRNTIQPLMAAQAEEHPFAAIAVAVLNGHTADFIPSNPQWQQWEKGGGKRCHSFGHFIDDVVCGYVLLCTEQRMTYFALGFFTVLVFGVACRPTVLA